MKVANIIPLGVAVVLAGVTIVIGRGVLRNRPEAAAGPPMAKVLVATRDLEPGQLLRAEDLTPLPMPPESQPPGVILRPEDAVGRALQSPLFRGQALVEAALASRDSGEGIQVSIPAGMRAVTIDVADSNGMGTFLNPGCRVDLIATLLDETSHQSVARTIVTNILVSAVGQRTNPRPPAGGGPDAAAPSPSAIKSVTLVVTPQQAEAIDLATSRGRPRLVLRSLRDGTSVGGPGVTVADLLGLQPPPVPAGEPGPAGEPASQPSRGAGATTPSHHTVLMIKQGVESSKDFVIEDEEHESNATQGSERRATTEPAAGLGRHSSAGGF